MSLETRMRPPVKHSIRNAVIAVIVIGGGLLFLYTSISHPWMLSRVWAWVYCPFVVLAVASLAIRGVDYIRRRRD